MNQINEIEKNLLSLNFLDKFFHVDSVEIVISITSDAIWNNMKQNKKTEFELTYKWVIDCFLLCIAAWDRYYSEKHALSLFEYLKSDLETFPNNAL